MIPLFRYTVFFCLGLGLTVSAQDGLTQAELAAKPPYERMLQGADLTKAQELEDKYQESMDARKFPDAKKFVEELVALRTRLQGANHWQVTDARFNHSEIKTYSNFKPEERAELAKVDQMNKSLNELYENGQFANAAKLSEQISAILKKLLGENHPDYATCLNNLGLLYQSLSQYYKAERLYIQSRDLYQKLLRENHPSYATCLNNLAMFYESMGEYGKAEPLSLQALELRKKLLGENHPEYATSLNNLGWLYTSMGEYGKAEPLLLQAIDLKKKLLGENHPDYATCLSNLSALYKSMAEYAKAESLSLSPDSRTEKKLARRESPRLCHQPQ